METDPQTVSAYLVYLSQHTPVEEQGQHSDLALVRGGDSRAALGGEAPSPQLPSCPEQASSVGKLGARLATVVLSVWWPLSLWKVIWPHSGALAQRAG